MRINRTVQKESSAIDANMAIHDRQVASVFGELTLRTIAADAKLCPPALPNGGTPPMPPPPPPLPVRSGGGLGRCGGEEEEMEFGEEDSVDDADTGEDDAEEEEAE